MKIEQKIETGGSNRTSTPILKFLRNRPLLAPVSAARHIEHCALASIVKKQISVTARTRQNNSRHLYFITAPLLMQAPRGQTPEIYNATLMNENCRGRKQRTSRCKRPASARASVSNSNAQTSGA